MELNRMMFIKRSAGSSGGDEPANMFVMTMGQQGGQYGYSRYNATIGEVTGGMQHDGRAVTLVMVSYYGGWLDVAFQVEGVTSGSYNITLNITPVETGVTVSLAVGKISYGGANTGFYKYVQRLPSNVSSLFVAANVGKQFKVELIFN